jgi:hypothetical protein
MIQRIAAGLGVSILLMMTGVAAAQNPAPVAPMSVPNGYASHETVDVGGHMVGLTGSGAMYDTLVNIQSGPRVLGETFEMHALPGTKHTLVDSLSAIGNGFGGDPNNFAKLDFYKNKIYDFSGIFRRDRQYFDYDLLGNPNITTGATIPVSGSTTPFAWPQVKQSPVMFNTVRRMTDTNFTIFPLSKVTFRAGYSQNIFEGPSLSPGESVGKYDALLEEYQRNSTDDFTGGIDWKPVVNTKLTFEEEIDHYKADSYFTLAPSDFIAQEADGTPVSLGNWDSQTAYSSSACYPGTTTVLSAPQTAGGRPILNPACSAITSYMRSQPTRILYPTEIFRFQSSSIKNISMDGDFRYSSVKMNLPNYYENFQGLDLTSVKINNVTTEEAIRNATFTGSASARRQVVAADYGIDWQASKTVSLSDQINFSNVHQPGTSNISAGVAGYTPAGAANETINYSGPLVYANSTNGLTNLTAEGSPNGTPAPAYFGQRFLTNNLTGSWDATSRTAFSLTYRYRTHMIAENEYSAATSTAPVDPGGNPGNIPLAAGADTDGTVTIDENGGIFNAVLHPTDNWDLNGSAEVLYADNAFTPVGPRQTKHYRVHTLYRPKIWATISGAYNDLERHNNTNNTGTPSAAGPLGHVDHSRIVSLGATLSPNEHYGLDFNYAYSDVYAATNICYYAGAASNLPGAATASGTLCPGTGNTSAHSSPEYGPVKDFMDAPTQSGSVALTASPIKSIHSNLGYRISSVNGSQFFNDARAVNGSLDSTYQTPYVNLAWTIHPGLIWKAEYNFYGYGEGGPSGAALCSLANPTATTAEPGTPCNSSTFAAYPTGLTEPSSGLTAPRNFHANEVTLAMHYEF